MVYAIINTLTFDFGAEWLVITQASKPVGSQLYRSVAVLLGSRGSEELLVTVAWDRMPTARSQRERKKVNNERERERERVGFTL